MIRMPPTSVQRVCRLFPLVTCVSSLIILSSIWINVVDDADAVADVDADVDADDADVDDDEDKTKGFITCKTISSGIDVGDTFFLTWTLMLSFVVSVRGGFPIVISLYRFAVPILNLLLKTRPSILVAIASHFLTSKVVPYLPFLYKPISSNNS